MATPVVRFETNPSVIVESEATPLVFTFKLSEAPPSGGITVTVNGNVSQNLTQLDLFDITVTGGEFPQGDFDFSGFTFKITSQTATISIPFFQDGIAESPVTVTYTLAPGSGYIVSSDAKQDSVIFRDNPAPPENNPPVANDDGISNPENQVFNGNVLSNDTDPNSDTLTVTALNGNNAIGSSVTLNSGAIITLNANGTYSYNPNGQFNYLNNGQVAGDIFSYTISDGKGGTDTANVIISITGVTQTPVNQNPIAVNDSGSTTEKQAFTSNVLINDGDPNGDNIVVSGVNGTTNLGIPFNLASGASLILNADGNFNYNSNGVFNALNDGQTATDSFTYEISDGKGGLANATVTIIIQGITDVPAGFDPASYAASNPLDLISYYINSGYSLAALTNHYLQYGQNEGRLTDTFDEFRYIASSYPGGDLIGAFGNKPIAGAIDSAGATLHYINHGWSEGRSTTSFDPARYINSWSDLVNAPFIGTNTLAGTQHFITNGFAEGRDPNLFPSDRYLASNSDLINAFAFITDYAAKVETASNHYLNFGRNELGRSITFDPAAYLANPLNGDIAANPYFGTLTGATQHYIQFGFAEQRSLS
ncbi:hypothetical protein C7H19_10580 [Aphanothece hegewaldii CCALA 016]|uniref:Tandem-95 repeat protein n=1 Tax=Aphanothece hegewaldii CCALA 016 TaxID=2107694 RepID=A0A2T1LY99_9CHRO|nr:Ig-like domain-containing protein [Aphanothece hegewaldii]PSF37365.1 hypothetical protein C7H19_10580 [Aphanothece hegewaldii CCALA 016]